MAIKHMRAQCVPGTLSLSLSFAGYQATLKLTLSSLISYTEDYAGKFSLLYAGARLVTHRHADRQTTVTLVRTHLWPVFYTYRTVKTFKGENFHELMKQILRRKLVDSPPTGYRLRHTHNLWTCYIVYRVHVSACAINLFGTHLFSRQNFHGWSQIHKICERFLPRKFPAIRYVVERYACLANSSINHRPQ